MEIHQEIFMNLFIKSVLLLLSLLFLFSCKRTEIGIVPEKIWVVTHEVNTYEAGFSQLDVGFINTERLKNTFQSFGENVEILSFRDSTDSDSVKESLRWLDDNASKDDLILFYIGAHGSWIRKKLGFQFWFSKLWNDIKCENKIFLVDSCNSEIFINRFKDNTDFTGIASSACTSDELGWWGVEEEGLPINGSVWVKYLTDSIIDPNADTNENGYISFEEAFYHSRVLTQGYMRDYVLVNDNFRKDLKLENFPYLEEKYPNPVFLKSAKLDFEIYKL
jgi:hypothetical protein